MLHILTWLQLKASFTAIVGVNWNSQCLSLLVSWIRRVILPSLLAGHYRKDVHRKWRTPQSHNFISSGFVTLGRGHTERYSGNHFANTEVALGTPILKRRRWCGGRRLVRDRISGVVPWLLALMTCVASQV